MRREAQKHRALTSGVPPVVLLLLHRNATRFLGFPTEKAASRNAPIPWVLMLIPTLLSACSVKPQRKYRAIRQMQSARSAIPASPLSPAITVTGDISYSCRPVLRRDSSLIAKIIGTRPCLNTAISRIPYTFNKTLIFERPLTRKISSS